MCAKGLQASGYLYSTLPSTLSRTHLLLKLLKNTFSVNKNWRRWTFRWALLNGILLEIWYFLEVFTYTVGHFFLFLQKNNLDDNMEQPIHHLITSFAQFCWITILKGALFSQRVVQLRVKSWILKSENKCVTKSFKHFLKIDSWASEDWAYYTETDVSGVLQPRIFNSRTNLEF